MLSTRPSLAASFGSTDFRISFRLSRALLLRSLQ